jgi:hypothetical protein
MGTGEADHSRDREEAEGLWVQGSTWMCIQPTSAKEMASMWALLGMAAGVRVRDSLLPVLMLQDRKELEARLTAQLWG